ncbi:MAG TPA: hypothetical protein VKA34_03040 [Balneolales bacterium]|nr:hypothetical protein [Balneolales bacterium]
MQNRPFTPISAFLRLRNPRIPKVFGMLRFRSRSGFDIEQNPWFCKAFLIVIIDGKT